MNIKNGYVEILTCFHEVCEEVLPQVIFLLLLLIYFARKDCELIYIIEPQNYCFFNTSFWWIPKIYSLQDLLLR